MPTNEPPPHARTGGAAGSWREQAVARSLDPARARAEARVQRFLDAALELMSGPSGRDFTVQEVVERSGQSLRSFYQHFGGKHELLLALVEEGVRSSTEHLRAVVADEADPGERVHRFVIECHRICQPTSPSRASGKVLSPEMAELVQQLLATHPTESARAVAPIVALFVDLLDGAVTAGVVRDDLPTQRIAGVVLQVVLFNAFARTISGLGDRREPDAGEELWRIVRSGIGA